MSPLVGDPHVAGGRIDPQAPGVVEAVGVATAVAPRPRQAPVGVELLDPHGVGVDRPDLAGGLVDVDVEHLGEVAQLGVPGRVGADGHRLPGDGIEGLEAHVGVFRHPQVAAGADGGLAGRLQLAGAVATAADHAQERARPVEHADVIACPVGDVDPVAGLVDGDPAGVGADDAVAELEHLGAGERPGVGAVVEGIGDVHPTVLVVDVDAVHAGHAAPRRNRHRP